MNRANRGQGILLEQKKKTTHALLSKFDQFVTGEEGDLKVIRDVVNISNLNLL